MKYAVKIIALLLFIFFNSRQLTAQELFHKSLPFETLTLSDGLSQGMINCMLQDRYGFLWFGTKDGLNRYDGYHFTIYRHSTLDTNSISDNFIKTLYEDSEGRLWIGTSSHGAELFNRETEKFSHFRHSDTDQNSLTDDRVNYLTGDHYGNIWIGTLNGLNKLSWKNKRSRDENNGRNPEVKRYFSGECSMFLLHDGTIWGSAMGTVSFRIYPVAEGNDRIDTLDMDRYCYYPANDRGFEKFIGAMIEDTMRQVVYLFTEYSISAINTGTGEVQVISRQRNHYGTFGRTLCMDDQQVIWISESDWLEQFDVQRKKWYRILPEDHRLDLMLNNVSVTYRDRSGIIWIGTKGYGLLKYNSSYEKFHKTGHESIGWMGTTIDDKVMVMANGIFMRIFDPGTSAYSSTVRDSDLLDQVLSFKDFGTTTSAVQGANGIYWLSKSCLVRYDLHKNVFQRFRTIDRFDFPVFLDHSGKIWIGTADFLSCFDTLTHRFTNFQYPVPVLRDPYEFLQCIHEDATGILWMGTVSGLLRFDPVKTSWKQYKNIPGDVASLSYDVIFSICADPLQPAKYLWIGTNGGGLNRFDIGSGKCICYSDKDGIPNDVIYGILSDEDNNLWLSTNNGLCRFNPQTKAVKNFEEKDGLQGNEFNRYAFCKTKSGELFFGGVNGFNHFNPKDLHDNPYVPRVEITDFRVRNKPVSHQSKNSLLSKPIYLTDKIILPYTDNMISFDFASFDFTAPGKNLYQYKLDEFDQSWIQSGNNHSATYTNLDPGTYTFRVKGSNSDGVWNNTETSLQLVVRPPWYMMWWFRIAAAGAVAIAIYLFYRYRLDHALRLQSIRNRIAQDLHDEIGSNLSNISIFSTVAKSKTGEPQEINSLLTLIKDYTQTSMEAMSDIVWMINARNDRFENIIVRMRSLAAELFEAQYCHFHLSFDERLNALKLGMEERKNFYLIYKEALNNIVKYANSKNVWIEMKQENGNVKMHIRDDGSGFDLENHKAGNGLFNMKKRGEMLKGVLEMHSAPGEGTTVRLQFPV